jgi:hypothetical protein
MVHFISSDNLSMNKNDFSLDLREKAGKLLSLIIYKYEIKYLLLKKNLIHYME